jgi:histone-lysine N-methyltransferase SETMAR
MSTSKEQIRLRLLHEFQLGHNAAEACRNVCTALGNKAVCESTARKWIARFREGETDVKDKSRRGRPKTIDSDGILAAVEENPTFTTRMLADDFQCSHTKIEKVLRERGKKCRHGKWTPHELTSFQKISRLEVAKKLLERHQKEPFLHRLVTADEKWIRFENPHCSHQWLSHGQGAVSTPKPNFHQRKVMLCVWWWIGGVIHWELVDGSPITAELYSSQLERVQIKIRTARLRKLHRSGVILLHDNARPHVAHLTAQKMQELDWEPLIHPAYSPDIAPTDFYLFRSLQHSLTGKKFENLHDIETHLSHYFVSKSADWFRHGIELLPEKWQMIIDACGDYFD